MSNLNEQIIKSVNQHIDHVCKDYKETTILLESLPIVLGLKKRIIELEKEVLLLRRQSLIDNTEKLVEEKIEKILKKNINLEVIEKKTSGSVVSEEEIEKEVDKKDPQSHSHFSSSLWDFNENNDDGEAYVYDSDEQKSENEDDEDDEDDENSPILAQLKALGFNANSINQSNNDEEITSKILTSVIEGKENIQSIDDQIGSEYDEEDNELVGSEKWAIEAIKENHKADQERDDEEEEDDEEVEECEEDADEEEVDEDEEDADEEEVEEDEEDADEEEVEEDDEEDVEEEVEVEVEDANDEEEEEEEEEIDEVEEIEIDGEMYYTTDKKNGIIYEYLQDEEVGDEVGHLEEGILFLS